MPEVLGIPPSPRTVLFWNGAAWQWGLVDAAGHVQIDVLSSVMDAAAATAVNQALMLAQLQLIEDMRDALQSVATDRLIVRGEDQLFSIKGIVSYYKEAAISGANGFIESGTPAAFRYWVVTTIAARDTTNPTTGIRIVNRRGGQDVTVHQEIRAIAAAEYVLWRGLTILDQGATIRAYFAGGLVGDTCRIELTGYVMTVEV